MRPGECTLTVFLRTVSLILVVGRVAAAASSSSPPSLGLVGGVTCATFTNAAVQRLLIPALLEAPAASLWK
ncbi:hypothetical protein K438DRAFT_1880113 [Mycena galopus ATCC 62051]|nr:hypothetical protein K438DRAFT_1880113 [Mycena galopus ATCC 62051]